MREHLKSWSRRTDSVGADAAAAYQRRLYDECVTAGWDSAHQNTFAEEIAHLHEELSEAFRAYRLHKDFAIRQNENGKPEGVPIEFADIIIGLFYNAELHGFDLFAAIEEKRQFNLTRNYNEEGRQLHPITSKAASPSDAAEIVAEMARAAATQAAQCRSQNVTSFGIIERYEGMTDALREVERRIRAATSE